MNSFPYYRSLDGIRGLAVLMVVLIHVNLLPIGWVGVQIFFVLSGFLITGILLTQTNRPFGSYIGQFYWRRGLRIWPLYFLVLVLFALTFHEFHFPGWARSWPWLASFTYNLWRVFPANDSEHFGHFWTLCIEEQFYLFWPFVVFFCPLEQFRRVVIMLVASGPALRFAAGVVCSRYFNEPAAIESAVHNLPTSHLDAFAAGAFLAILPHEWRQRISPRAALILVFTVGITAIAGLIQSCWLWQNGFAPHWLAFGYAGLQYGYQYVWAFSFLNLSGAALIFCAIESKRCSDLLSFRPLVYIGTISYGLYVWHLPMLRLISNHWVANAHSAGGLLRFAISFLFILSVATASYFGFERYFLKLKQQKKTAATKITGATCAKN